MRALWLVPGPDDGWDTHFVDLQRDVTVADVHRSTGAGMRGVEHVKRYTSLGTANDQGKTSGVNSIGVIAEMLGGSLGEIGTTAYRAPYTPIAFAALAGRERGELFDPERTTSLHSRHVAHGAEFEDVGQWKRPWYYPQPGEDMDTAVARECRAAREGVAFMDASTLGKIKIRGADVSPSARAAIASATRSPVRNWPPWVGPSARRRARACSISPAARASCCAPGPATTA